MATPLIKISYAAVATLAIAAFAISSAAAAPAGKPSARPAASTEKMYVTFYGWYDNSPPGCATAYSGCAGGAGTFSNPITFATDKNEIGTGTRIYVPQVHKYFKMGDDCTECDEDWTGQGPDGGPHFRHVDLWVGGQNGTEFDVINCEDALTKATPSGGPLQTKVIVNPPSGLTVSSHPLFYGGKNKDVCDGGVPYPPSTYGQYKNKASSKCLDIAKISAGAAANEATCTSAASEDLGFDGAFFMADSGKLCLKALGGVGSGLNWSSCSGGPPEQWEFDANHTIVGIQSNKCVAEMNSTVQMENCHTGNKQEEWFYTKEAAP